MTCASCSEDVRERRRVKYPCWTASSCYQYELLVLTDSLIVGQLNPAEPLPLGMTSSAAVEGKKKCLVCTWPNCVISCQHLGVNHLGVNACVMSNPQSRPGHMTCASCSEDVTRKAKAAKGEIPVLYSLKLLQIVGLGTF